MERIQKFLFENRDLKYRDFNSRLIPTVEKERVIGVRTPVLRKYAKSIAGTEQAEALLMDLPHKYFEEDNLHGFLIEQIKDYDKAVAALNAFLPFVDNWATCDMMQPKVFKKNRTRLIGQIETWLKSGQTYTVRYAMNQLMGHFLGEDFKTEYLNLVADYKSDEYYIQMMQAWYFATALAKQYAAALPIIENRRLDAFTHSKAIQKAIESYRITDGQKAYLRTLK